MGREEELQQILAEEEEEEEEKEYKPKGNNFLSKGPVVGKGRLKVRINLGLIILLSGSGLFLAYYLIPLWTGGN